MIMIVYRFVIDLIELDPVMKSHFLSVISNSRGIGNCKQDSLQQFYKLYDMVGCSMLFPKLVNKWPVEKLRYASIHFTSVLPACYRIVCSLTWMFLYASLQEARYSRLNGSMGLCCESPKEGANPSLHWPYVVTYAP